MFANLITLLALLLLVAGSGWAILRLLAQPRWARRVEREGVPREAEVVGVRTLRTGTVLELAFDNLAGRRIVEPLAMAGAQAQALGIAAGSRVPILIDPALRWPLLLRRGARLQRERLARVAVLGWLWALAVWRLGAWLWQRWALAGGAFERLFQGWELTAGKIVLGLLLVGGLLARLLLRGAAGAPVALRLRGLEAQAEVVDYRSTGTRINDAPVVAFRLRYRDADGREQQAQLRRLVDLVDLGRLPQLQQQPVRLLYLPQQPGEVHVEDLFAGLRGPGKVAGNGADC